MAPSTGLRFQPTATEGAARRGLLALPHGAVETPAFMPVATYGAVRGVGAEDLTALGAQMLLANTFHLHERPGEELIARAGGLHGFTPWRGPWLTDSGGFQVTSLANRVQLSEKGIAFSSPLDGRRRELTPERAVQIQQALGADVAMVLDECIPTLHAPAARVREALARSLRWAARCKSAHRHESQALFAIVQGGLNADLRRQGAAELAALHFPGYAHGGLGLGEGLQQRGALITAAHAALPPAAPRYLMGIGRPQDVVEAVAQGVDLFDCTVPTRNARHGLVFTNEGALRLTGARFAEDFGPLCAECNCPVCARASRAYVRHLLRLGESLGARLASLHNLAYILRLMRRARAAISAGRFDALRREITALYGAE